MNDIPIETFLDDVTSDYQQFQLYTTVFGYVKPQAVALGTKFVTVKGKLKEKSVYRYTIPFVKNLKCLVELPEIWSFVNNPHFSKSNYTHDICDGIFSKSLTYDRNVESSCS